MSDKKFTNEYFQKALSNLIEDREKALILLEDASIYIKGNGGLEETKEGITSRHKTVGPVAAKYMESVQRANEQLVKLTAILVKKESEEDSTFDLSDDKELKEKIYEIINPQVLTSKEKSKN